jgi:hypothetical protein
MRAALALTLNQVTPHLGFLSQPLCSPPLSFWTQFNGQPQFFGSALRK